MTAVLDRKAPRSANKPIIILDDRQDFVNVIVERLQSRGYMNLFGCVKVSVARAHVKEQNPWAVISDWRLEDEEDGIDFIKWARSTVPKARCTLLTGFTADLDPHQRGTLTRMNIRVSDKADITTSKLQNMIEGRHTRKPRTRARKLDHTVSDGHIAAKNMLLLEQKQDELKQLKPVTEIIAEHLVSRLSRVSSEDNIKLDGFHESISLDQIINDIRSLTPRGLEWIRLYQKLMMRLDTANGSDS